MFVLPNKLPLVLWVICVTAQGSSDVPISAAGATHITDKGSAPTISVATVPHISSPGNEQDVAAILNGREVTVAELDASIRMQLYELDLARYKLRSHRLKHLVVEQVHSSELANTESMAKTAVAVADTIILLEPPIPPRFEIETGDNEVRGNPGAPVTIIEFLDFESPHSRRIQPVLHQLLEDYGPVVRLIARDLPLHYHRHAKQAAVAAECARAQGRYWRYHDLLLQKQNNLSPSGLIHHASTLGLNLKQFQVCLDDEKGATAVQGDVAAAQKLGLLSTPTFFINGLYLKGPRNYSEFARLINRELVRLGFLNTEVINSLGVEKSPFRTAPRTTLPLALTGTILLGDPIKSAAVLHNRADNSTHILKKGDTILKDFELVLVDQNRAYFQYGSQLEYLPLAGLPDEVTASDQNPMPSLKIDAVLTVDRFDIDRAFKDIDKLESILETGSLDLEGKRLLKLTEIEPGSFYDLLGLQAKDVLMQVDGKWVHSQQNPLWRALRTQNKLTLTIMRKGFPKTFQYVINEGPK